MMKRKQASAGWLKSISLLLALILMSGVSALFIPWGAWGLSSHPHPIQNYAEAAKQIEALRAARQSEMNPDCLLQFLTHGQKVRNVMILVHGYTSCPAQFGELGQQFYNLGYNVLIAPLPHHGLADRLNNEQGQLTAQELTAYADRMMDLAHGLGERVDMMGISGGGVTTAWAAQNRVDLDTAVIISPAFGYLQIPTRLTAPAMNLMLDLPDTFEWWDADLQEKVEPSHAYPRYSKHSLAQFMKLGFAVQIKSRGTAPAARRIIMVTNANDISVNNELTSEIVQHWQNDDAHIETYEFPLNMGLGHDLIDPQQPNQEIDLVYPELIDLLRRNP